MSTEESQGRAAMVVTVACVQFPACFLILRNPNLLKCGLLLNDAKELSSSQVCFEFSSSCEVSTDLD